ncbi:uncharacterized protein Z519_03950 [Cladophialophora bantiana CBS 173.52]|uniref:Zn(2)-C6 fungal-type domain-containing protein n=1 Tax=Cladophialophora bantiana (strain ATCC 10958 / CBS 173.52 / CDC B-1940 / NIH 8579) TaxID=1442370 RepID=A0A0D2EZJ7_CLAB1|nr:uncharacterized protein Z519_03950 [Cladophialophora bantiana CBS 173.52]KIW95366.1 hypothetical protein Z519_03950 [Cladophialophora bantiana CBS 173.52]
MGRRPNPLMAEFFERGAKIGDSSNRYEQTCKRCGEHFSRGRTESMVTHLTKKCTAVSHAERTKIILRLHDLALPDVHPYIDPNYSPQTAENDPTLAKQDERSNAAVTLPFGQDEQNFDGLNVLAEASRRVGSNARGNTSSTSIDRDGHPTQIARPHEDAPLDPRLEAGAFSRSLVHDDGIDDRDNGLSTFQTVYISFGRPNTNLLFSAFSASTTASLPPLYHYMSNIPPAPQGALTGLPLVSTHPQDLPTIAATAHATIGNGSIMDTDLDMSDDVPSTLLGELHENGFPQGRQPYPWQAMLGTQPMEQLAIPTQPIPALDLPTLPPRAIDGLPSQNGESVSQHLRPIAMNPIRQPDALSEDAEPLSQAPKPKVRGRFAPERRKEVREIRKVGACMRCRMLKKTCSQETPCQTCAAVESPRLWKHSCVRTRLSEVFPLYFHGLHGVLAYHEVNMLKTRVRFTSFPGRIECSHFADQKIVMKGLQPDPDALPETSTRHPYPIEVEDMVVMDLDTDNLLPKVERYLQAISSKIVDQEPSLVMRASLQIAQTIQQRQQSSVSTEKQDNLVSDVIELWVATSILIDHKLKASFATDTGLSDGRALISETTNEFFHHLLSLQLRAAVEKRASIVCRSVMNHFEQRVLSRRGSNNFETFLIAFVLLNCVERMCWLYRFWDFRSQEVKWPLDQKPAHYAEKGKTFAQMILMMINMRQMEPKIKVDPHSGSIATCISSDTALAEWLAATGFTRDLAAHFALGLFDADDSRSLDGVFSARLLQAPGLPT